MNTKTLSLCLGLCVVAVACKTQPCAIPSDPKVEEKVEQVLGNMTLEDKVGQMCQIDFSKFMDYSTFSIDYDKMDQWIEQYRLGSILNTPWGFSQTPEVYSEIINHIQQTSMRVLGIPCLYGLDQNHGASYTAGATLFPQEIGLGASFNRSLATTMGQIAAYETRASMVAWTFNPTMDLTVNQSWPRVWESFGEDVLVNGEMGKALSRGYQGDDPNHLDTLHVASCIKHFMAYGATFSGQDRTPSSVLEKDMKGRYFEPFRKCLEDGALSLMVNSASNAGIPFHANGEYLTKWVKEDLGWDGMIITDFNDLNNLYTREFVAVDKKDAIRIGINSGIDMVMEPGEPEFCTLLKELVEEGKVSMDRIDDAVRRILRLKVRLGLFDHPTWDTASYDKFASPEFAQKAYEAALESEILLKNDGILPLKEGSRILLCGPNANSMRTLNGGWSYIWQGAPDGPLNEKYNTIYEAMSNRFRDRVVYKQGVKYEGDDWRNDVDCGISEAVAASRSCDVVVCCVGENSYCETPGNIVDLNLSDNQKKLVKALSSSGKPIVLILNEGRPRIIHDLVPLCSAIVDVLLPGNYGGDALASLLSGDENFSARLPYTYPAYPNALANYDFRRSSQLAAQGGVYNYDANVQVEWYFGHGLSYTEFEYSNFSIDKTDFGPEDTLNFSVDVTNVGSREGKEAVLLYSSDLIASITPEVRRLRAFDKISLMSGETKTLNFSIPAKDLAFVDSDMAWTLEEGEFRFSVGEESLSAHCTKTLKY